jgi:WD40 repeat protein
MHEMSDSFSNFAQADGSSLSRNSHRLKAHMHKITGIDFSHDSQLLASCSWDKSIIVWGVLVRQQFARVELSSWPTALIWAPARLLLACATMDRRIVIHLASHQIHPEFLQITGASLAFVAELRGHDEGVWSLAWLLSVGFFNFLPASPSLVLVPLLYDDS